MSIQQVPERSHKKSYHKWHDLEAARYFSGSNEVSGHQKMSRSGGRISLDIPMMTSTRSSAFQAQTHQHNHVMMEKAAATTKEKKHKQPHSPGGRLASFLNSIFSQTSSKKKKSKSCSAQSTKDEDHESPDGRRKRRSSISHFRSVNSAENSSSEFTTPRCTNTPAKNSFKDFKNFLDHHKPAVLLNVSKNNCPIKSSASQKDLHHNYSTREISTDRDINTRLDDDNFKFSTTTTTNKNYGFPTEKCKIFGNGYLDHDIINQSSERNFRNFVNEIDDGADSDSSSDLFELQNFDLGGCFSSGLPVYETTHMDSIKRGAPITSGAP